MWCWHVLRFSMIVVSARSELAIELKTRCRSSARRLLEPSDPGRFGTFRGPGRSNRLVPLCPAKTAKRTGCRCCSRSPRPLRFPLPPGLSVINQAGTVAPVTALRLVRCLVLLHRSPQQQLVLRPSFVELLKLQKYTVLDLGVNLKGLLLPFAENPLTDSLSVAGDKTSSNGSSRLSNEP